MAEPVVAQTFPYKTDVEEEKSYTWCACRRSANQPFCDGSHAGTGITPKTYTATETKSVRFCGCKASKTGAICDGAHNNL